MTPATKDDLVKLYGTWGEHPDYAVAQWQYEVAEDDTRAGYWEWVVSEIESDIEWNADILAERHAHGL